MTENYPRTPEGKIRIPEFEQGPSAEQQARRQAVEQAKEYLAAEQKRAVYEAPHQPFKYRLPVDLWQHYERAELDEIQKAEEVAFNQHRGPAMERANYKRAWIAAGGDEESFNRNYSEEGAIAARAAEIMERGADSPY